MVTLARRLWSDEDGPTAVEYGLLVALIAVVIIIGATFVGQQANIKFSQVGSTISGVGSGS